MNDVRTYERPTRNENGTELKFKQLAMEKGWLVTKRGWPDFICFDNIGKPFFVEVKPRVKDGSRMKKIRKEQAEILDILSEAGFRCYVSDGEVLEPWR